MDRRSFLKTSGLACGRVVVPISALAVVGCTGAASSPDIAGFDGKVMGTGYSVRLGTPANNGLAESVHAALLSVDSDMSTWRSESELSGFNNTTDTDWQEMSAATVQVIAHALTIYTKTGGAFDCTVGPLVDLWGFGPGEFKQAGSAISLLPEKHAINRALAHVGSGIIEIDMGNNSARKFNPSTRIDLSGIAKGYAVDRVAKVLAKNGIEHYLIEVGGEIRSSGYKPDGGHWRVAIERPTAGRREVFRVVNLPNQAIATSGNYRNFFLEGGQRYSHTIDPRMGMPVTHDLASVSVVAESAMIADALSTAFMVLGPDEAMAYAKRHQIAAQFILKSGDSLKEERTASFDSLLA